MAFSITTRKILTSAIVQAANYFTVGIQNIE